MTSSLSNPMQSGVQRRSVGQGSTLQRGNTKLEGSQQATPPNMTGSRPSNHIFEKKTYFQPTYCQHCTKMLWGLKEQGLECRGLFSYLVLIMCNPNPLWLHPLIPYTLLLHPLWLHPLVTPPLVTPSDTLHPLVTPPLVTPSCYTSSDYTLLLHPL